MGAQPDAAISNTATTHSPTFPLNMMFFSPVGIDRKSPKQFRPLNFSHSAQPTASAVRLHFLETLQ
jgi:hypothetical protein